MAISLTSLVDNLVYGIFGEPFYFAIIMLMIFSYYSIAYDIPKWISISFFFILFIWIAFYYLDGWVLVILLMLIGIIISPRLIRSTQG